MRDGENTRVSRITTVVFDLNGTLTDPADDPLRATFHPRVAALLGVDAAAYGADLAASYVHRAEGAFTSTRAMLADAAARLGATPDDDALARATAERMRGFARLLQPRADALETLAALADAGYRLGLVSDCSCETVELWDDLPYARYIAQPVFSCSFGARKPTAGIYREACRRLGVEPVDCAFVGDGGSQELTGARAVGMHAVLLRNEHVAGAREHRVDPDHGFDGPSIGDLRELPAYLAGLTSG
jgi:HAD superfamily hydrolase (TIGR01549 family)